LTNQSVAEDPVGGVSPTDGGAAKRRSLLAGIFALLALVCFVLIPVARAAAIETDRQVANMGGLALGLLGGCFSLLAILAHRRIRWPWKVAAVLAPVLAVVGFVFLYEFAGFNGEVWPTFRLRSALKGRAAQSSPIVQKVEAMQDEDRGYRFSQFLGSQRDGKIDAPEFSMAWNEKLPQIVWRRQMGAGWSGFAVARGMAITLEQREDHEVLCALRLSSGETVWEHMLPGRHFHPLGGLGPRSTPTVVEQGDQGWVVAQSATGVVACVELATGKPRWQVSLLELAGISQAESEQEVMWGRSGSPLVVDDVVFVPLGGGKNQADSPKSLIALGLEDGAERWRAGTSQIAYTSPTLLNLDGELQLVSVNEGNITGHDPKTGAVWWTSPWPSRSNGDACASQPVAVDGRRILIGKGYAQGSKLIEVRKADGAWTASDVWTNKRVLKTKFTNSVVEHGKVFALSDGVLECVDPNTGTREWRGGRFGQGQLLMVNGTVLISAEDGRIASVDAASGKLIGEMSVLEGVTWNVPAVAGPYLLVRNATEAVCLRSPK
jgi:outer membrane protein assembly factor BamB